MRSQHRSSLVASLIPASLVISVFAVLHLPQASAQSASASNWT